MSRHGHSDRDDEDDLESRQRSSRERAASPSDDDSHRCKLLSSTREISATCESY